MQLLPIDRTKRLRYIFSLAWSIVLQQIAEGKLRPTNEATLQLHLGYVLQNLGMLALLDPEECFHMELEKPAPHGRGRLDLTYRFNETQAAVELKFFRKPSTSDAYDCWKDISRLQKLEEYALKIFLCLSRDNSYLNGKIDDNSQGLSIADNCKYMKNSELVPPWKGKWKDKSYDKHILIHQTTECHWSTHKGWSYLLLMFDQNG